jgi:hypothetical protein
LPELSDEKNQDDPRQLCTIRMANLNCDDLQNA